MSDKTCGCGKPTRYFSTMTGEHSCNKYQRCPDYEGLKALLSERTKVIEHGLKLIALSEAFDINLGNGWKQFKKLAKEAGLEITKDAEGLR